MVCTAKEVQTNANGYSAQKKRCLPLSHQVFSEAALITIYIRCLPASAGAKRSFNLLVKELGEGMESAVKCPLQSRVISVQKNTEVTNGEGKKKKGSKDEESTWDANARLEHLAGSMLSSFPSRGCN